MGTLNSSAHMDTQQPGELIWMQVLRDLLEMRSNRGKIESVRQYLLRLDGCVDLPWWLKSIYQLIHSSVLIHLISPRPLLL